MKAALKYPIFYLAPAEHMAYVFWHEENITTRRQLAEANGWAGQEVVDASGRRYVIRSSREIGPAGSTAISGQPTDALSATKPFSKRLPAIARSVN